MTDSERFRLLLKEKQTNPNRLSKLLSLSRAQGLYDIVDGKLGISKKMARNICVAYEDISENWLLTGEGNMLKNTPDATEVLSPVIIESQEDYSEAIGRGLKPIPEVDFKFSAGNVQLVGSDIITRYWSLPDCTDCEAVSQVSGNSMMPTFPPGCFVVLKRLSFSPDRSNEIPYGNTFGVVVEDRDTGEYNGYIKILRRHKERDLSKEYVIAHSINDTEYDDFDIPIQQIRSLWVVKQHIVSDML